MTLQSGDKGPDVLQLTNDLVTLGLLASPGTIFNADVASGVKKFQAQNLDPRGTPLVIDGEVGPLTKYALDVFSALCAGGTAGGAAGPGSCLQRGTEIRQCRCSGGGHRGDGPGGGRAGGDNLGPDVQEMTQRPGTGGKQFGAPALCRIASRIRPPAFHSNIRWSARRILPRPVQEEGLDLYGVGHPVRRSPVTSSYLRAPPSRNPGWVTSASSTAMPTESSRPSKATEGRTLRW